ncbi:MAG: MBL fold metallo-hydrolase [Enterobacterales bacterium]|nr:MBL fold metallo-hydrolase [Enterobacterales bacterium]
MKKLYTLEGNTQKLDGGAMFGNAPKAVWQNWMKVDEDNRIDLACRSLLVQEENSDSSKKNILFELGIGAFFDPKMKQRFGVVESEHLLLTSLHKIGLTHKDIDVIVLSHLHFDHMGGLLSAYEEGQPAAALFPNAEILVSKEAWQRALHPHKRDRASFIEPLINALKNNPKVHLVESSNHPLLGDDYHFHFSHGHTPGMMLTEIKMPQGPIVFCADLIPGQAWVHLPITMGYDRFPEKIIDEKEALFEQILSRNGRLFFTHDPVCCCGRLIKNEKQRFVLEDCQQQLIAQVD